MARVLWVMGKVTPLSVKSIVAAFALGDDQTRAAINVSAVCRRAGVSRAVFYKWVERVRAEGLDGLEERSRRPGSSPQQVRVEVEERIVRLRKQLIEDGLDHGATTIQWHLGRERQEIGRVPSTSTIHRVLVRRGLVVPAPKKRPKNSWRRFEAPAPNECWQIDHTDWVIATGAVKVFNIIDDHSRVLIRSQAVFHATSEQAWAGFCEGAQRWGLPAGTLSDNGLCFSGKVRHVEVFFESQLRQAGVLPITGRAWHPQTTGKVERFQQTLKRWLRRQPLAASLEELQVQLDRFEVIYNYQRPHQGIGRAIPIDRWQATPSAGPASTPLPHPDWSKWFRELIVEAGGAVRVDGYRIHLGVEYAGHTATVAIAHHRATIFINGQLARHVELDPTRVYQPSGRTRGGPRRPRLQS